MTKYQRSMIHYGRGNIINSNKANIDNVIEPLTKLKENLTLAIEDSGKSKLDLRILKNIDAGTPYVSELSNQLKAKQKNDQALA